MNYCEGTTSFHNACGNPGVFVVKPKDKPFMRSCGKHLAQVVRDFNEPVAVIYKEDAK